MRADHPLPPTHPLTQPPCHPQTPPCTPLTKPLCPAELMIRYIRMVGEEKVVAIVTDNAANMKAARRLVQEQPQYKHIITFRCFGSSCCLQAASL